MKLLLPMISLLLVIGCGIEIGNPTKPVVNEQPPVPGPGPEPEPEPEPGPEPGPGPVDNNERDELALAAVQQYEETADAGGESYESDESGGILGLLAIGSCLSNGDGTLTVTADRDASFSTQYPSAAPVRAVQRESSRTITALLSSPGKVLACSPLGKVPLLNWLLLSELNIESAVSRIEKRTDTDIGTGTVLEEKTYTVEGKRKVKWEKLSFERPLLTAKKTLGIDSTVTVDGKSLAIKTAEDLVVEQTSEKGVMTGMIYKSGAVVSDFKESRQLKMKYKDLVFQSSGACHPTSGVIEAEVSEKASPDAVALSFHMVFEGGEAYLLFADGTRKDLILAGCGLN